MYFVQRFAVLPTTCHLLCSSTVCYLFCASVYWLSMLRCHHDLPFMRCVSILLTFYYNQPIGFADCYDDCRCCDTSLPLLWLFLFGSMIATQVMMFGFEVDVFGFHVHRERVCVFVCMCVSCWSFWVLDEELS